MRRTRKPDADDYPVIEIELAGGEPDEVVGGAADGESVWRRIRREAGRRRWPKRRIAVFAASVATALAVGAIGMRTWDDHANELTNENTVAASISLLQGGGNSASEPTMSGTAHGSIQAIVHNAGPVPFSLVDVGTDAPNVRIIEARVVGTALVPPGENGQFDVSFATDCAKVAAPGPNPDYSIKPSRMTLRVRTAAHQLRAVVIPAPQLDLSVQEDWLTAQQSACGADAPPPMILTWPDTAVGFPEATVHGNTAAIPVTAILQRTRPATLRSIEGIPGVGIQTTDLPLTLQPRAPIAQITITVTVTDCTAAATMPQPPYLNAQVEDSGSNWVTSSYGVTADGRIALAIAGAISRICKG